MDERVNCLAQVSVQGIKVTGYRSQKIGSVSETLQCALELHSDKHRCKSKALIAAQIANFTHIILFWLLFLVRCYVEKEKARWCR